MFSKIVFLSFVLQLASGSVLKHVRNDAEDVYCYHTTEPKPQHEQFTTKTIYALIKGSLEESEISDCQPVKIWLLSRHGTIYPLDSTIDVVALKSLNDSVSALAPPEPLCEEDIGSIKEWKWNENINEYPERLSQEGLDQMKALAEDYKRAFGGLFNLPENVLFRHTTELRNNESFHAFATALFSENDVVKDFTNVGMLFKFYETCDLWNEKNGKLNEPESDLSKFENSVLFTETLKGISDRLGLSEELSLEQVKNIWDICRIDKALSVEKSSPWCSAFTKAHVDVLEYHDDMESYYKTGQGHPINSHLACSLVTDLINHLENDSTDSPKAIVSFADATTVQLLLTTLKTHKDNLQPATENMTNMGGRKWKSSQMSPFASNLAVVKYDCSNDDVKVKFFLNQKLLKLDWCTDGGVCGFNEFIDSYLEYKNANCTEYYCASESSGEASTVRGAGVIAVAVSLILIYLN